MYKERTTQADGASGGYRSRYFAFLAQRKLNNPANGRNSFVNFGQGMINFAIFIALFIGILALFGFGLSRLSRGNKMQDGNRPHPTGTSAKRSANGLLTPPTVYPSGHAEVKMPALPSPTSSNEVKKKAHKQ